MSQNSSVWDESKKAHRKQHSGRKAEKKKSKTNASTNEEIVTRQQNSKAFAFNSAVGAERRFRRKQDLETKRQHIPVVDRTPIEPPPILIAVVGPPQVGKTTLINNLVKLFSKSPLTDIRGPVTVVTGKKRRVTLIECNNDINSMIDLAKVADLALLLCDASFGFEMEIFEFLNICQVHGMPKIMGVLTHLDMIKNNKTLKNTKKTLKHRFWTEVYAGAKLFYLSGMLHGEYLRNEIKNLGRFISVMKFRPLTWRMTHSFILGDRYEDLTNLELIRQNMKCDRNISLYGYVRGVPLKRNTSVHIAGYGDVKIHDITHLPDPCPLPDTVKKRALIEKEKVIYAPFSGVGGIVYDKDAVYVELGGSHSHKNRDIHDETNNIVSNLTETKDTLDVKMQYSELQLFTGGKKLTSNDISKLNPNNSDFKSILESSNNKLSKEQLDQDEVDLNKEVLNLKKFIKEEKMECDGLTKKRVIFEDDDESINSTESYNDDPIQNIKYPLTKINNDTQIHLKLSNILKSLESTCDKNIRGGNSDSIQESESNLLLTENIESENSSVIDDSEKSDSIESDFVINEKLGLSDPLEENVNSTNGEDMGIKWKENLAIKAEDAYLDRLQTNKSIMKIVYGIFDKGFEDAVKQDDSNKIDELGGLFRVVSHKQQKLKIEKDSTDLIESSLLIPWSANVQDFTNIENKWLIENCFTTGKWKESEDANELLKLDQAEISSDSDEFGDFEDLETGEKFTKNENSSEKRKLDTDQNEKSNKKALIAKKIKLKQKFDEEYDNTDGPSYYDELKLSAERQAQLNKSVFENMPDDLRVHIEGYRPGMYVRLEFQNVPSEFVTNFDPTYPIVIGGLNMGEENIGYVNVKIKKHRWYKKILKANDPLIVSLGWRRFQTVSLYSKLEDDLKFRYLKYTPEHLSCNGHFWGPITPQGTGFLALQTCEGCPEIIKQQGFRIAATGAVQDLDKSTKITKKLKLVGYPMKIYKKTAFIKGMFNSALEVAKFEGARIKTVSGIRGQIKKAASKPEGCFRATFEDKIQLSDIVFCRTWYKVDVKQFYTPITTLLLPPDKKNSWKGIRTAGELKRELNIKNQANSDSLYREIIREPKVFKPLVIPRKLQQALPYRDKPNHGIKSTEKKNELTRIAVVKEPHEQKISNVMKMIKTTYHHKQQQLKEKMRGRLEKHRQEIAAIEENKAKKIRKQKKEILRIKTKMQLREERK